MLKSTSQTKVSVAELLPVLAALRAGIEPAKLTREIAALQPDSPASAVRLVDLALACLWLAEGAPVCDVLTVLEHRHSYECSSAARRAYAVEILWVAEDQMQALKVESNATSKESENALA